MGGSQFSLFAKPKNCLSVQYPILHRYMDHVLGQGAEILQNLQVFSLFNKQEMLSHLSQKSNAYVHRLNCKINSTNGGTFSKSAETNIFFFFLFQRALVMSKLVREYKILTTSHPEMSNGQFHCFHYGTPPKGTKTTQTQTLKRLVKINFFRK